MKILVTGAAGFIGSKLCLRLLERGDEVVGIDNLNDYYDVNLKLARLELLRGYKGFTFIKLDIVDRAVLQLLFTREKFKRVMHLAAQAGVRYSLINPYAYIESNITGPVQDLRSCFS